MSKIEYLSPEGLRIDGRRKGEVRNTRIYCGSDCNVNFLDYDGVCELVQGLNKVQVLVKGPFEDPKAGKKLHGILEEKIDIQCEIVISTEKRVKNSPNERLIKDLTLSVNSTFQEMITSHCYKGCTLSLFINIIEYDGSLKSSVINAVGVALIDAGVAMKDIVSSSTSVYLDSYVLSDPNNMETNASTAVLTIAFASRSDKIIYMDYKSKLPLDHFNLLFESCVSSAKIFADFARGMLQNYAKRAIVLNKKIHSH